MSRPGEPLKRALDARVDEQRIHAAWLRIGARVHAPAPARAPAWAIGGVALGGVVLAALALVALRTPGPRFLALADGSAPTAIATDRALELAFDDASVIALGAGASIAPTRNDERRFELELGRGEARFSVTPGGPRRWTIDCGLASVEVVGTVFTIDRTPDGVRVEVERGIVRVRAPSIDRELRAGDSIEVGAPAERGGAEPPRAAMPPRAAEGAPAIEVGAPAAAAVAGREAASVADRAPRWRSFAAEGAYDRAYDALGPAGTVGELEHASPRELLLLADVARLSGHPSEAVEPLHRLIDEHAGDPNAPIAAIVLARLEQDTLRRPREAALALERALALGVPASFTLDVESRLALARLDAGDPRGPELARSYLAAHPDGPRASLLRSRLE